MDIRGLIDLHMHTSVSDGTDSPAVILEKVKEKGLTLFSVTDHDAVKACSDIIGMLDSSCPAFITGAEFSCRDDQGKYHILGYGYDPSSEAINELTEAGHQLRMEKLQRRLDQLKSLYGFEFPQYEIDGMRKLDNPGKPHLGNLMAKYGFAESKDAAIEDYLNAIDDRVGDIPPGFAIEKIRRAGGIPVLAHPKFGDGDQKIDGAEMDARVWRLTEMGLAGLEAYYSGFSPEITAEMLSLAEKYVLYVTVGSDYHGSNKPIAIGETGLGDAADGPDGMKRFFRDIAESVYHVL